MRSVAGWLTETHINIPLVYYEMITALGRDDHRVRHVRPSVGAKGRREGGEGDLR